MKTVKHPCIHCIYFAACGDNSRTKPCEGRMTTKEKKVENVHKTYYN